MVLSLNVLTLIVVSWFFRLCHYLTIITKECHGMYNEGHFPKSHEEIPKLNDFLCFFKNCNALNFHTRVSNARLLHTYLNIYWTKSMNFYTQWVLTHHLKT